MRLVHLTRIQMTKNWLEFEQKIFTTTNLIFWICPKFMTPTNINFTQKNILVRSAWTGSPAPARKLTLAGIPAQPPFALQEKKPSDTKVRRTPVVKLRFFGFIRFLGFNFGHVQSLRFVIVLVRSYSLGHLDLVKWITFFSLTFLCEI